MQQRMTGQAGEGTKVALRAGVGRADLEHGALARRLSSSLALSKGNGQFSPQASSSASKAGTSVIIYS